MQQKTIYESSKSYCQAYLTEDAADLRIVMGEADIRAERARYPREELDALFADGGEMTVGAMQLSEAAYLELLALYRRLAEVLLERDVLLFHGSAVAVDGRVYLFSARSGTGKSTHTALWRRLFGERAVMVNDDKPLLKFDKGQIFVCGTPWDGKYRLSSNCVMPLQAVCLLERGTENRIREMADQDILYDSSRQNDVMNIMLGLGYSAESIGKSHHDICHKPPIFNFEMHTTLFGPGHDPAWVEHYRDIKNRLIPVKEYTFAMSWEDFYIHIVAHGCKHYQSAGTGLRTLTDQYVFLKRNEAQMDWAYIGREVEILGLGAYEQTTRSLTKKLFSGQTEKALSQEEEKCLNYILNSGVYGSMEHFIGNRLEKMDVGNRDGNGISTRRKLRIYADYRFFTSYFCCLS